MTYDFKENGNSCGKPDCAFCKYVQENDGRADPQVLMVLKLAILETDGKEELRLEIEKPRS